MPPSDPNQTPKKDLPHLMRMGPTRADTITLWKALLKAACYECGVFLGLIIIWSLGHARSSDMSDSSIPVVWRIIFWVTAIITVHVCVWRAMGALQLKSKEPKETKGGDPKIPS